MGQIAINKEFITKGKVSVSRILDASSNPPRVLITGKLSMHRYIEEITSIETDRIMLDGVDVFQENFGSEDFNIIYSFNAKSIDLKGGESHLSEDEIKMIEDQIYGSDDDDEDGGDE